MSTSPSTPLRGPSRVLGDRAKAIKKIFILELNIIY